MSPSRTWIKLHCERWLKGTLRQETREFRGDWADIMALAGGLTYGEDGIIQLAEGVGLTDEQIAGILAIKVPEWLTTKQRLLATERITVDGNNIIKVTNWSEYQSEYGRQKTYRQQAEPETPTPNATLNEYLAELRPHYPSLDLDDELVRFNLYWSEGDRVLKRPKLALRNWLNRARKSEGKQQPGKAHGATAAELKESTTARLR